MKKYYSIVDKEEVKVTVIEVSLPESEVVGTLCTTYEKISSEGDEDWEISLDRYMAISEAALSEDMEGAPIENE